MKVFKSRAFHRFAQAEHIQDSILQKAASEVRDGKYDADLGGGVFKKRIARSGGGKSGGYRTLLICTHPALTIFQYGFAKSARANIASVELRALKKLAQDYRALTLETAAALLIEVNEDEDPN